MIVFTRQSARHATVAPTCSRRSRCAPNLSTNWIGKRRERWQHSCMEPREIDAIVRRALDEDLPDITSEAIFNAADEGRARFIVKSDGVLAGIPLAEATFRAIDPASRFTAHKDDGDEVRSATRSPRSPEVSLRYCRESGPRSIFFSAHRASPPPRGVTSTPFAERKRRSTTHGKPPLGCVPSTSTQ